jgi:hypothetical protein
MILGTDFLLQNKLNMNFDSCTVSWTYPSTNISTNMLRETVIFESAPVWLTKGLLVPRQLVTIDQEKLVILVKMTDKALPVKRVSMVP